MELFKKHFWMNRFDLLVELAVPAGLWLLLELIVDIAQSVTGDYVYFGVPAVVALFGSAIMELFVNGARMCTNYSMGLAMGRTRRCMLGLILGESVTHMALAAAAVLALNLMSVGMDRLLGFPARESLFALIPWWVWPVTFLAALAVGFASGILLLAFGQRGFWAMWGIWMVAFIVPANTPGLDFAALPAPLMIAGAALAAAVLLGWLVWSVWYALHCPVKL